MRKLLCVLIFVAVPVFAAANLLSSFKFKYDSSPVAAGIAELKALNDPVYEEINRRAPGFEAAYTKAFVDGLDLLTNGYSAPRAIFDRQFYPNEDVGIEKVFQMARPPSKWFMRPGDLLAAGISSIVPKSLQSLKSEKHHNYRFCEANPKDRFCVNEFGYGERYIDYLGYTFARRIVSMPAFVSGFCEQTIPVMKWYVKWSELASLVSQNKWRENLEYTFKIVDDSLTEIYGDGVWNSKIYEDLYARGGTKEFLFRRYLDGGPEVVKSMQQCLNRLRQEAALPLQVTASVKAGEIFDQALGFQSVGFTNKPSHKIVVQSRNLNKDSLAQITRLVEDRSDLGAIADWKVDEHSGLNEAIALTSWMSLADSRYDYRIISKDELMQTLPDAPDACTVNKDYVLYGMKGLKLFPSEAKCSLPQLILVREEK